MKKFFLSLLIIFYALSFCSNIQAENKKTKIAVATFSHETCTFCPSPTGVAEWEYYGLPMRGENVLKANDYVEGFVDFCREFAKDVELIGIYSPRDSKGSSSGSWVTKEAFDKYTYGMIEDLKKIGPVDGVFLALHGAMAVDSIYKAEEEIAKRIRSVVGDKPIFVTLDLHANEDRNLAQWANAVFITKQYPHYDERLQGERAAMVMLRTIKGTYKPVMAVCKPNIITPSIFQWTGESPAMEIMERARRWEERAKDVYVSVAFGFAYADVPDIGATVMVVTNNNQKLADQIANDMNEYIWSVREKFAGKKLPKTKEGVALAVKAAKEKRTPVVIADHSDRTGNATHILEELIRQGASNFCITTLADSLALRKIVAAAEVGDNVSLNVGGYTDQYSGNPVPINGKLTYLGSYDRYDNVAVIRFGENNYLILTPVLHQETTINIFKPLGIDLNSLDIIVLKSRVHFRRGYDDNGFAKTIILIDAPGLGPADLSEIPYKNIPNNLYPLAERKQQK